ncbi:hypothetical protein HNY73_014916 [Argiope bruennichi]|uniref:Uncharacterized protein n=1 Tax=Argiope bruennichi TaxID=94029 RepID=A0A8T0ERS1_ARGBR|nr:hypothetical protein HNY73_014916 [Argiope bruennichi]
MSSREWERYLIALLNIFQLWPHVVILLVKEDGILGLYQTNPLAVTARKKFSTKFYSSSAKLPEFLPIDAPSPSFL